MDDEKSYSLPLDPRKREHRAVGLGLHNEEWDALFEDEPGPMAPAHRRGPMIRDQQRELTELDYKTAVRLAREAACPSRHNTPRKIDLLRRVRVSRVVGTDWMKGMVCGTMGGEYAVGVGRRGMVGCGVGSRHDEDHAKEHHKSAHLENISTVTTATSTFDDETSREGGIIHGEVKA